MVNYTDTSDLPLWGEVEKRFANVKSVKEFNDVRQKLLYEWEVEHDGKIYKAMLTRKEEIVLPYFLYLCYRLDSSGLIVRILGKNFKREEDEIAD